MKKQLQSSLILLFATIIWGAAFVAQSVGMDHIGPFAFQAARCLIAVIGLIPVIAIFDIFKKDILQKGKDPYKGKPALENIRFLTDEIVKRRGQGWRVCLLFERK